MRSCTAPMFAATVSNSTGSRVQKGTMEMEVFGWIIAALIVLAAAMVYMEWNKVQ